MSAPCAHIRDADAAFPHAFQHDGKRVYQKPDLRALLPRPPRIRDAVCGASLRGRGRDRAARGRVQGWVERGEGFFGGEQLGECGYVWWRGQECVCGDCRLVEKEPAGEMLGVFEIEAGDARRLETDGFGRRGVCGCRRFHFAGRAGGRGPDGRLVGWLERVTWMGEREGNNNMVQTVREIGGFLGLVK